PRYALEPRHDHTAQLLQLAEIVALDVEGHVGAGDRRAQAANTRRTDEDPRAGEPARIDPLLQLPHPFIGAHLPPARRLEADIQRPSAGAVGGGAPEEKSAGRHE